MADGKRPQVSREEELRRRPPSPENLISLPDDPIIEQERSRPAMTIGRCAGPVQDQNCGAWECPYGVYPDLGMVDKECTHCEGEGIIEEWEGDPWREGDLWSYEACDGCYGTGIVVVEVCQACEYGEQPW